MLWTDPKTSSYLINVGQNAVSIDGGCSTCWRVETCMVGMYVLWCGVRGVCVGGGGCIGLCLTIISLSNQVYVGIR